MKSGYLPVAAAALLAFGTPALAHGASHHKHARANLHRQSAAISDQQRMASNSDSNAAERSPGLYEPGATSHRILGSPAENPGLAGGVSDGGSAAENGRGEPGR